MGKYADLYRKKYEEAKASGKWQLFITDPPMWMLVNFSLDQNMDPLKDDYEERLYKLREEDEEMFNIMVTAFDDFLKQMDKSFIVVDSTPDDAPPNWRRLDIYQKKS